MLMCCVGLACLLRREMCVFGCLFAMCAVVMICFIGFVVMCLVCRFAVRLCYYLCVVLCAIMFDVVCC